MLGTSVYLEEIYKYGKLFAEGADPKRCIWIESGKQQQINKILSDLQNQYPVAFFPYRLERMKRSVLGPIRQLLGETKETWSQWPWIIRYSYEINTLLPGYCTDERSILDIAHGWSEVRLNREIHWGFRLIHFSCLVIKELARKKPIILALHDFQYSDRLTVHLLYHLLHNLAVPNVLVIVNVGSYSHDHEALDNGKQIGEVLERLRGRIQPYFLVGDSEATRSDEEHQIKGNPSSAIASKPNADFDLLEKWLKVMRDDLAWYNLENVLSGGDLILSAISNCDAGGKSEQILFNVWRYLGIAYVFMDAYTEAKEAMKQMNKHAHTPSQKAKTCHFLALLYGKRLSDWEHAKQFIAKGLEATQAASDFETMYERAWLLNYLAYMNYSVERDYKNAWNHVQQAYSIIQPFGPIDAEEDILDEIGVPVLAKRLLGNLTANMAYLHYYEGHYQDALRKYREFVETYVHDQPKVYEKEDYYFVGNIYLHLKQYDQAIHSFQQAFHISEEFADHYHTHIIGKNLAYTYFLQGNYHKAIEWYNSVLSLKIELGVRALAPTYQSLIICHLVNKEAEQARAIFEQMEDGVDAAFSKYYLEDMLTDTNAVPFLERGPALLFTPFIPMDL